MNDSIGQTGWAISEDALNAPENRGSYHPFGFAVRLRQDFYHRLDQHPGGICDGNADPAILDAFSTYFHETVHWWQHIGSTTGLLLSAL